jgi:hypothetical protein
MILRQHVGPWRKTAVAMAVVLVVWTTWTEWKRWMAAKAASAVEATTTSAPAAAAPVDIARWARLAEIRLDAAPAKGIVEAALPPEVFAGSREDLGDLRLVGPGGSPVPFVLRVDRGEAGKSVPYEPARLLNPVFVPHKESSITVDFGGKATRTCIDVQTPGTNFRRRVMVEAGTDGAAWQVLRQADWLFRVAYEGGRFAKDRVTLPDNDFRFLRVTVYNAPDDAEQVKIEKVLAWYIKDTPSATVPVPVLAVTTTQKPKIHATEIEADLGFEKLPLQQAVPAFADEQFLRRVEVLGRDCTTRTIKESVEGAPPRKREVEEPWQPVASGVIHRFASAAGAEESVNLRLALEARCRWLLLRIYNGDNAPLNFTGLKVDRHQYYVAFQPKAAGAYRLYFGNAEAAAPQYDLGHFIARLRAEGVTPAALAAPTANPDFAVPKKVVPWTERNRGLLWIALIVVAMALAGLVFKQARRAPPGPCS